MTDTLVTSIPALQPGATAPVRPGTVQREPEGPAGHVPGDERAPRPRLLGHPGRSGGRSEGALAPPRRPDAVLQRQRDERHGGRPHQPHRARRHGDRDPRWVLRRTDRRDGPAPAARRGGAHRSPGSDRAARPGRRGTEGQPRHEAGGRGPRRDLDRRPLPRARARRADRAPRRPTPCSWPTASPRSVARRSRRWSGASTTATRARRSRWGAHRG